MPKSWKKILTNAFERVASDMFALFIKMDGDRSL